MRYTPFLPLRHNSVVTHSHLLPRPSGLLLVSLPTAFESTTLVAALGVDAFFAAARPVRQFDQLGPEFGKPLVLLLVVVAGVVIVGAPRLAAWKTRSETWK